MLIEIKQRILFVGPVASGKTSIINKRISPEYSETPKPTVVEVARSSIEIDDFKITQNITDIGGTQNSPLFDNQYRNKTDIVITIDSADVNSIKSAQIYIKKARNLAPTTNIYLVATKSDKECPRPNFANELENLTTEYKLQNYFVCSATNGNGIDQIFQSIANNDIEANFIHYKIDELKKNPSQFIESLSDDIANNDGKLRAILKEGCFDLALSALLAKNQKLFSKTTLEKVGKDFRKEIKEALFKFMSSQTDRESLELLESDVSNQSTNLSVIFQPPGYFFGLFKDTEAQKILKDIRDKISDIKENIAEYEREKNFEP